jgi:nicotinate-nucleotide adenylyltransferase
MIMHILLGGSFDPVHTGHLATAEAVRTRLGAHCAVLLPAARSPLKTTGTADHHRLAMLQCAIADYPALVIDERELHRPPPSYTVDTLREVRNDIGTDTPLVWVMGSDALAGLAHWKEWQSLIQLAHLLVVERTNHQTCVEGVMEGAVAEWLATQTLASHSDQLQCRASGLWLRMALPPQPFSSTDIRHQLMQRHSSIPKPEGLSVRVWQYILDHHLYEPDRVETSQ